MLISADFDGFEWNFTIFNKISTDFDENWAFGTDVGMFYGGFDIEIGWKPQKQGFRSNKNSKFLTEMLSKNIFATKPSNIGPILML